MWDLTKKAVAYSVIVALLAVMVASGFLTSQYLRVQSNIESIVNIDLPQGLQTTKIYARDYDPATKEGTLLANLFLEHREFVPLQDIPDRLVLCTLASEDKRFYQHHGVDVAANLRALVAIARSRSISQGGSTITQQLARNVFLPYIKSQKTLNRKVQEIVLAQALEKKFSKQEILESYLNNIYYGAGAYGVKAAASTYFGKDISELTLAECALIAGLPQRPSELNPFMNKDKALGRRNYVLRRLLAEKEDKSPLDLSPISTEEIAAALEEPISLAERTEPGVMRAPYFTSWVREQLYRKYGEDQVLRQGLVVVTTLDWEYQQIAEKAITEAIDKYRDQRRVSQGALVCVENSTGNVLALVGGYDYRVSKYNRAVQNGRQVGSAFKPFVYAAALSQGIPTSTILRDLPMDFKVGPGQVYSPKNSDLNYRGMVNMVYALQYSRNAASVDLMNRVGPENAVETAHKMGIKSDLPPVLSLPLGVANVTPLEMAAAFACFPRGGTYIEPVAILRVYDRNGVLLEDHTNDVQVRTHRALEPVVAWQMVQMMRRVVTGGTGTSAQFRNGAGQLQPAGGKTGTTDDYGDAWFVGYTPTISTAVWFGNDDHRIKMARVFGATIPAPTWKRFMAGVYANRPKEEFKAPPGAEGVGVGGASVRPLESLEDVQVEGYYTYPFTIRVEDIDEELIEDSLGEETPEEQRQEESSGSGPSGNGRSGDEHHVYF